MPPPGYEPFLRAICARPDDDTPRLVYADWLDENGDPDRAEFIRLSVEFGNGSATAPSDNPRWWRMRALFKLYEAVWKKELPGPADVLWDDPFGWHRGFPERVSIVGSDRFFMTYVEEIVRVTPAQSVILARFSRTCDGLAACHHMLRFRRLYTARTRLGDDRVAQLANSPYFGNLEELGLAGSQMGDAGGLALARSPYLDKIRSLSLTGTEFSPTVRRALTDRFGDRVQLSPPGSTWNAADL
jgi:uncharacterized protein (TIGR02996 family)